MGRRIAALLITAGVAAAIGWPTAAFAAATGNLDTGLAVAGVPGTGITFTGTGTSAVDPCGSTFVSGTGFKPGESITVTLGSVTLGETKADANGSFSVRVTIPAGTRPGNYKLVSTGATGFSSSTDLTVEKGGCLLVPVLSHNTVVPGESTLITGQGCVPGSNVVLTISGKEVAQATANGQGRFSAEVTPPGSGVGEVRVTATCGSRTFDVFLAVVATSRISTPEGATAVFGVFVLFGVVLLRGMFGSNATRRRRKRRGVAGN
jgi:hypothetical protein